MGSAACARTSGDPRCRSPRLDNARRSIHRRLSGWHGRSTSGARGRCRVRAAGVPRHLGAAAASGRSPGVYRECERGQTPRADRAAPCRQRRLRSALGLVLERRPAQRRRRQLPLRDVVPQEHQRLAAVGAEQQRALQPLHRAAAESGGAGRSRRVPGRRQLARRGEREPDARDAGRAEQRPGLSRDQPQVQLVPRQLHQQMAVEGRVQVWRASSPKMDGSVCTGAMWHRTSTPHLRSCSPS